MEKFKLTRGEKAWILYDVGNSAFIIQKPTLRRSNQMFQQPRNQ